MSTTIDYQGGPGTFSFTYGQLTEQNQQCTVALDGLFDDPNSYGNLLIKWTDSSSGIPCQISYTWGPGGGGNPASLFVSDMSGVQWTSPSNSQSHLRKLGNDSVRVRRKLERFVAASRTHQPDGPQPFYESASAVVDLQPPSDRHHVTANSQGTTRESADNAPQVQTTRAKRKSATV
jgi:hypothetical protein